MEQHALGRIYAEPLEQLRIAQRQLDHFAKLIDRRGHPADIVIGHVGAPALGCLLELGPQLDFGILVDMDDALGRCRDNCEADLLQRIGRRIDPALDIGIDDAVMPRGGDDIALRKRAAVKGALERLRRTLEPQIGLGRRKHDASRRFRHRRPNLDEIARADAGIGALEPVDTEQFESFVLGIRQHRARRRGALADDLDHVAFGDPERRHLAARDMRDAAAAILGPAVGNL